VINATAIYTVEQFGEEAAVSQVFVLTFASEFNAEGFTMGGLMSTYTSTRNHHTIKSFTVEKQEECSSESWATLPTRRRREG
jgi:hypothetical protein